MPDTSHNSGKRISVARPCYSRLNSDFIYGRFHAATLQEARHDIPFLFALNPYRAAMTR
ncbi:MAG: hypothetical protein AB2693_19740 [Candidatus Thiodiazotropha sp.]